LSGVTSRKEKKNQKNSDFSEGPEKNGQKRKGERRPGRSPADQAKKHQRKGKGGFIIFFSRKRGTAEGKDDR